ncbi:MAG: RNA-binding S4 domain-containing protein [Mangrovibacterium sp.]
MEFTLQSEYIELIKLLKLLRLAESGGMAKQLVEKGLVSLNGKTEYRKRAKLRKGDVIRLQGQQILLV